MNSLVRVSDSAPLQCSYAFHKNIYRCSDFDLELRKQSAVWLIANGVLFDNDKFIDPENLPS